MKEPHHLTLVVPDVASVEGELPADDLVGPLSREEMMGFANLAFAGGRDTIIHTVSCALGHLAAFRRRMVAVRGLL